MLSLAHSTLFLFFAEARFGYLERSLANELPMTIATRQLCLPWRPRSVTTTSAGELDSNTRIAELSPTFLPNVKDEPHGRLARGVQQHDP